MLSNAAIRQQVVSLYRTLRLKVELSRELYFFVYLKCSYTLLVLQELKAYVTCNIIFY